MREQLITVFAVAGLTFVAVTGAGQLGGPSALAGGGHCNMHAGPAHVSAPAAPAPAAERAPNTEFKSALENSTVAQECQRCHSADRIDAAVRSGRDADAWAATLDRMRLRGARVSADEAHELAEWLAERGELPGS